MKRLKPQSFLLTLVSAASLTCASQAMAGSCTANAGTTETLNFGASLANTQPDDSC